MYGQLLIQLAVVAFFAWVVWTIAQPRCAFVVRIDGGMPEKVKGVVTTAFLSAVKDMAQSHGVQRGAVRGLVRGRRIALGFSRSIPPAGQQQLRNWWALSGWPATGRKA